ncbi:MAG: hypothetical protein BMS9Abin30_0731 [Gammaproteobacteria bacterium]|nr:MAG: hypothetical protein BMS9Abin30_0731 [Gammaproteobacteria bacterium]
MRSPANLIAKPGVPGLEINERANKDFQLNKHLYERVGNQWAWNDKLVWPDWLWKEYAEAENLRTWVASFEGALAGYYELQIQAGGQVEIAYFGLLPEFIGQGLGGYLLTTAIKSAWSMDASRVWLHTCSLDHPGALGNYQARGMKIYKTEIS